jgi:cell division protease FtsH
VCVETQTSVRLADVSGIDEAKAELEKVLQFLRASEHFRRLGGKIPKGVQIVGDPGTGKRLLAKAVPAEVGVSFLSISGSKFVGVAAAERPRTIFIDELDALGKARGMTADAGRRSADPRARGSRVSNAARVRDAARNRRPMWRSVWRSCLLSDRSRARRR